MFLLRKSIEIGKSLILCAPREFKWSLNGKCQNLLAEILTSSRPLVKSHKGLQRDSPEAVLEKSWSENFHKKFILKKLLWSPFFSYITSYNFTEKEPHHSYFPMTFEKISQNIVCVRTLVKDQKKLKYSREHVLEQSWPGKFHKIHPRETVMKSFFS